MDLGGARNTPSYPFPLPGLYPGLPLAPVERRLLLCPDTFRKQCAPSLHPSLSLSREGPQNPLPLFLILKVLLGPPTVPPHTLPRTTPTPALPALPALSGSAATSFLACDLHLCQTPAQRPQPKDSSSPASRCNPKAVLSGTAVVWAQQGRWGGHTEGKGALRRGLLNRPGLDTPPSRLINAVTAAHPWLRASALPPSPISPSPAGHLSFVSEFLLSCKLYQLMANTTSSSKLGENALSTLMSLRKVIPAIQPHSFGSPNYVLSEHPVLFFLALTVVNNYNSVLLLHAWFPMR